MKEKVYEVVKAIPRGKVATYGQIAIHLGNKNLARAVGNILHNNPDPKKSPCHRVVNCNGKLANSYAFGGPAIQKKLLEAEGVVFKNTTCVDLKVSQMSFMNKKELIFYDAYEAFYRMAGESNAFRAFCKDAFGEDFSQDGFSDIEQIHRILQYIPQKDHVHILDIGCGNGKMLGYLQEKTNAYIHGFDYSEEAIKTAKLLFPEKAEFREGIIGETERCVFVGYQEGDVIPKTEHSHTTMLAEALKKNGMHYEAIDITGETYELLKRKRMAAMAHQKEFEAEGYSDWFEMLMGQTEYATEEFEQFKEKMARYIYVARK